jgi:hypothetical protein
LWIRIRKDPKLFEGLDPELEVMDPEPAQELDLNFIESKQKISNFIILTKKMHKSNIFYENYALKSHKKTFKIVGSA